MIQPRCNLTLLHPSAAAFNFANPQTSKVSEVVGSTGIIRLNGVIEENLVREVGAAVESFSKNDSISQVAFVIQSGGGGIPGVKELADRISMMPKPKYAFVSGLCASAAYWIASSSDLIFTTETSEVGGVGVYLSFFDDTKMLEEMGLKVNFFASGPLKGLGSNGVPLTEDQATHLQGRVNDLADIFKSDITSRRAGIIGDSLQGQTFLGRVAVALNVVDSLVIDERDFFQQIGVH